jgi:S-(hydroxymethyl)glutathione dehydrogenase/alcohol dehydrogenase
VAPRGGGHRLAPDLVRLRRPDGEPIGVYSGVGTHATGQVVDAAAAIPVDPRTPADVAALIGCAATTGVGAVRATAGVRQGETVVVIGLGGVGLAALMAAVDAGASVIAVDREPAKLALAAELGADLAIEPGPDLSTQVRRATDGGADHAFECIGLTATAEIAVDLVRPGGAVTLVGMTPQGERAGIDVYRFVEDGKRLLGSNYGSAVPARDFPAIAADVVAGRLPLGRLVTEHIGLGDLDAALEAMRRRDGARRVVVFPGA